MSVGIVVCIFRLSWIMPQLETRSDASLNLHIWYISVLYFAVECLHNILLYFLSFMLW